MNEDLQDSSPPANNQHSNTLLSIHRLLLHHLLQSSGNADGCCSNKEMQGPIGAELLRHFIVANQRGACPFCSSPLIISCS